MPDNFPNRWHDFSAAAYRGELFIDDEQIAHDCFLACDKRIRDLQEMVDLVNQLQSVSGFGDFDMADKLASKFRKQASGEPNSADQIIRNDIEVVKDIRTLMAQSFKKLTGQDLDNASGIRSSGERPGG